MGILLFVLMNMSGCITPDIPKNEPPLGDSRKEKSTDTIDEERLALEIGNGKYSDLPLPNPRFDAKGMKDKLEKKGFFVISESDANKKKMEEAIQEFKRKLLSSKIEVSLFYYSGHGAYDKENKNYMIPLDKASLLVDKLKNEAVNISMVRDIMWDAGSEVNIIILDACRKDLNKGENDKQGLADMEGGKDMIIAFAAAPGEAALSNSKERYSWYTKHLLNSIEKSIPIETILTEVKIAVMKDTGEQQKPWYKSSMSKDFYF